MSKAVKDVLSNARRQQLGQYAAMSESQSELQFNESLCARVQALRKERGWTAEQMATALGVPPDRYRKYETRSPLPAYLMERFSLIVNCDLDFLLTGRSRTRVPTRAVPDKRRA